ncbi:hypothetical protein DX878_09570 [Xylella fastidiosa subsp. fastidiosa]|nr:hypothetical protein JT24_11170 [Xylella fastidiosa]RUA35845.1 hypothetical protein DX878_09570 [Xylella fastidiosa subsp. fastidiosa]
MGKQKWLSYSEKIAYTFRKDPTPVALLQITRSQLLPITVSGSFPHGNRDIITFKIEWLF